MKLMERIFSFTEKIPYEKRVGIQYLNRIMKECYSKVKKSPNFDPGVIEKWKEMTLVDKYLKEEINVLNEDEDLVISLGRKCALDRKSPAHIELAKHFMCIGDYAKACRQIKKFLNFSDNYKSVEGF